MIFGLFKKYREKCARSRDAIIGKRKAAIDEQKYLSALVDQHNLIQIKQSPLSRSERDNVELKIAKFIAEGKIKVNMRK